LEGPHRNWTKEEQMAYLDWEGAEGQWFQVQVEATIAQKISSGSFIYRRGIQHVWDAAEADHQEQQALWDV
jgi:hypothetical protein